MPIYQYGSEGPDTLNGSDLNDAMYAFGGDDVLVSSARPDTMNGGLGADTFKFRSSSEASGDLIEDYHWVDGDKIDVSAIDAKEYSWSSPSTWGNQAFSWKGDVTNAGPYGGLGRGELGYVTDVAGETLILGNTDGDSIWEFQIRVSGYVLFIESDFVL